MNAKWIEIATSGGTFDGYLALPPTGKGPGVVIAQEIFGLNEHIRSVAEQYAQAGFVALAGDLFWRVRPHIELGYEGTMGEGFGYLKQIGFPTITADFIASAKALRALPEVTGRVGSVGYCVGGTLAFLAAAEGAVDAAVSYYGGGTDVVASRARDAKVPVLFHYAERDSHITPDNVKMVRDAFGGREDVTFHVHEGGEHGFNCWARSAYDQKIAAKAYGQTLMFLSDTIA